MNVNRVATILGFASWVIELANDCGHLYSGNWKALKPHNKQRFRNSLPDNDNLVHSQCRDGVILSIIRNQTGYSFVYSHYSPDCAFINYNAGPKIVHPPLTLIFRIR
jgi:hypothetical protein